MFLMVSGPEQVEVFLKENNINPEDCNFLKAIERAPEPNVAPKAEPPPPPKTTPE